MKNLFFFLAVFPVSCFLFPSNCSGQQFKAGLLAGISTSQVDGDSYAGYDKAGLTGGAFVSTRFSPASKWSASFELTYIQKGSRKVPHPDKGDYTDYSLKLNYAEVPLLVRYAFSPSDSTGERMKFMLEGGLGFGTLIHSEELLSGAAVPAGTSFQKVDFSLILGINYLLSEHFMLNVRYEYSMMPVRKGATGSYYQNWTNKFLKPGYYNNLLVFSLRYQF